MPGGKSRTARRTVFFLENRRTGERRVIGRFLGGRMEPEAGVLDTFGVQALRDAMEGKNRWAVVDEIGFLENSSPAYCRALGRAVSEKTGAGSSAESGQPSALPPAEPGGLSGHRSGCFEDRQEHTGAGFPPEKGNL